MSEKEYPVVNLEVKHLVLDYRYPRGRRTLSFATECEMVEHLTLNEGIADLARSITREGPNWIELVGVIEGKKDQRGNRTFIVIDGNKRTCALKLLADPASCNGLEQKYMYVNLLDRRKLEVPNEVKCRVYPSRLECYRWTGLIDERGSRRLARQFIGYAFRNALADPEFLRQVPEDRLAMLLSVKQVRHLLGITRKNELFADRTERVFNIFASNFFGSATKALFEPVLGEETLSGLMSSLLELQRFFPNRGKPRDMRLKKKPTNPFNPGSSAPPRFIEGRRLVMEDIDEALERINNLRDGDEEDVEVLSPISIIGQKGHGKTTLVGYAERIAKRSRIPVVELTVGKDNAVSLNSVGRKSIGERFMDFVSTLKFTASVGYEAFKFEISRNSKTDGGFLEGLKVATNKGPLLVLIDDAHKFPLVPLDNIVSTIQKYTRGNNPVALVITEEPQNANMFNEETNHTFDLSGPHRIGLLSDGEVQSLINNGFEIGEMKISTVAMNMFLDWAKGYPKFVHLAGKFVWKCSMERKLKEITADTFYSCIGDAENLKESDYLALYDILRSGGDLEIAARVADILLKTEEGLRISALVEILVNKGHVSDQAEGKNAMNALFVAGYIYEDSDDETIRPGIPSVFEYVKERYEKLH